MAMLKYFPLGRNESKCVEKQRKLLHFFHFAEINILFSLSIGYFFLLFASNMIMIMIVIMVLIIYLFTWILYHLFVWRYFSTSFLSFVIQLCLQYWTKYDLLTKKVIHLISKINLPQQKDIRNLKKSDKARYRIR